MPKTFIFKLGILATIGLSGVLVAGYLDNTRSANLGDVSITLSNSRPSFRGSLAAGNTVGTSQLVITTTAGSWPSTSSAQLVIGDELLTIGADNTATLYSVTDVVSDSTVNIDPILDTGDATAGDDLVATSSSSLTVRFSTTNAIANGSFRILLPAVTDNTEAANGIPDGGAFDFGTVAPTVTCPTSIPGYTFAAGTATANSVTLDGVDYHAYECSYTGNGAIGTDFDGVTNDPIIISSVINPAPKKATHSLGYADTYRPIIQHLDSTDAVADFSTVAIGVVEAVRITAEVAPQITFRILGLNSGTSACGFSTSVTTTPSSVPFGYLSIDGFTYAAQGLAVSTNASNGYVVTAIANDQLGRNGGTCLGDNTGVECIPDSVGNTSNMSHTYSAEWSQTAVKGFAFSLHDVNTSGTTPAFQYTSNGVNACTGAGTCFRQFADDENAITESPQEIMTHTSVADNHNLYVCYKAIISALQAAGTYSNYVTYTATATF
jgi:hypothetical protein